MEIWEDASEVSLEGLRCSLTLFADHLVYLYLEVDIFLKKEEATEKGALILK